VLTVADEEESIRRVLTLADEEESIRRVLTLADEGESIRRVLTLADAVVSNGWRQKMNTNPGHRRARFFYAPLLAQTRKCLDSLWD